MINILIRFNLVWKSSTLTKYFTLTSSATIDQLSVRDAELFLKIMNFIEFHCSNLGVESQEHEKKLNSSNVLYPPGTHMP